MALGLKTLNITDRVDFADLNDNFEKIDAAIGSVSKMTISSSAPTDEQGQENELWFQYE